MIVQVVVVLQYTTNAGCSQNRYAVASGSNVCSLNRDNSDRVCQGNDLPDFDNNGPVYSVD